MLSILCYIVFELNHTLKFYKEIKSEKVVINKRIERPAFMPSTILFLNLTRTYNRDITRQITQAVTID